MRGTANVHCLIFRFQLRWAVLRGSGKVCRLTRLSLLRKKIRQENPVLAFNIDTIQHIHRPYVIPTINYINIIQTMRARQPRDRQMRKGECETGGEAPHLKPDHRLWEKGAVVEAGASAGSASTRNAGGSVVAVVSGIYVVEFRANKRTPSSLVVTLRQGQYVYTAFARVTGGGGVPLCTSETRCYSFFATPASTWIQVHPPINTSGNSSSSFPCKQKPISTTIAFE